MSELKAYQVGENDIVAAYSEKQAVELFIAYCSSEYGEGELDATELPFEMELQDSDGNFLNALGEYMKDVKTAEYLFGWE